jgi:hypothetical protein
MVERKLKEIIAARGRKGTDRAEQVRAPLDWAVAKLDICAAPERCRISFFVAFLLSARMSRPLPGRGLLHTEIDMLGLA